MQLITVHAAKGLEWQLVAVPHLCEQVFPSGRSSTWLTDDSYLPPQLRGDFLDLPALDTAAIAAAYGMGTVSASTADELREAVAGSIASGKPGLVEVGVAPGMWLF